MAPDQELPIIALDDDEIELAWSLAFQRLNDVARHHSVHRPTARNAQSQYRGAAGEIAVAKWLSRSEWSDLELGFLTDDGPGDITVGSVPVEVMTAKISDRRVTGFCVPPSKLAAARGRGAWGYIFAGTGTELSPREITIQAGCPLNRVALDPPRDTFVSSPRYAVRNYVVRPEELVPPWRIAKDLRSADHREGHSKL